MMQVTKICCVLMLILGTFACSKSQEQLTPEIPAPITTIPINAKITDFVVQAAAFASDINLYALGNTSAGSVQLYKSTDGGISWIKNTTFNQTMNAVYFLNDGKGLVAGNYFGSTANSGSSWQVLAGLSETVVTITPSKTQEAFLTKLLFDNTHGRKYTEIYTFDWATMNFVNSQYITLDGYQKASHSLVNKVVVFAGEGGKATKATLNSQNEWAWDYINTPQTNNLQTVAVISEQTYIVAGVSGTFLKTTNAGTSWTPISTNITGDFQKMRFIDATTGYAIVNVSGKGGIYKTSDGGTNWTKLNLVGNDHVIELTASSKGKIMVVGSTGNIYLLN